MQVLLLPFVAIVDSGVRLDVIQARQGKNGFTAGHIRLYVTKVKPLLTKYCEVYSP